MNKTSLLEFIRSQGYASLVEIKGKLCGLQSFSFTTELIVGLDEMTYERRYCYEHLRDAAEALSAWDGNDHPGGPWIKCKGSGLDLLNPALGNGEGIWGEHAPHPRSNNTMRERSHA